MTGSTLSHSLSSNGFVLARSFPISVTQFITQWVCSGKKLSDRLSEGENRISMIISIFTWMFLVFFLHGWMVSLFLHCQKFRSSSRDYSVGFQPETLDINGTSLD